MKKHYFYTLIFTVFWACSSVFGMLPDCSQYTRKKFNPEDYTDQLRRANELRTTRQELSSLMSRLQTLNPEYLKILAERGDQHAQKALSLFLPQEPSALTISPANSPKKHKFCHDGVYCPIDEHQQSILRAIKGGKNDFAANKYKEALISLEGALFNAERAPSGRSVNFLERIDKNELKNIYTMIYQSHLKLENPERALPYLQKLADMGGSPEKINAGNLYLEQALKTQNQSYFTHAFTNFEKAYAINKNAAAYHYANVLYNGFGCTQDTDKAISIFKNILKNKNSSKTEREQTIQKITDLAENGNMQAQCIMATISENALRYCKLYIQNLVSLPMTQELPNERFNIYKKLQDHSNHNKEAKILLQYNDFLEARHAGNQERLDVICSQASQEPWRRLIFDIFCSNQPEEHYLKRIKTLELRKTYNKKVNTFIQTDGFIAIPLLEQSLSEDNQNNTAIRYLLGLLYIHQQKYSDAHRHFSFLVQHNTIFADDLLTRYRILESNIAIHTTPTIEIIRDSIHLLHKVNKAGDTKSNRDKHAQKLIINKINELNTLFNDVLVQSNNYELTYEWINILLQSPETMHHALDLLLKTEKTILDKTTENRVELLQLFEKSGAYASLKKLASTTEHQKDASNILGQIFIVRATDTTLYDAMCNDEQEMKNILSYLENALKDDSGKSDTRTPMQLLYAKISYTLGKKYKDDNNTSASLEHLDNAIKHGDIMAKYTKAQTLLAGQSTLTDQQACSEALALLQEITESDDSSKILSVVLLGRLYHKHQSRHTSPLSITQPDMKKSFSYLKAATRLSDSEDKWLIEQTYCMLGYMYQEGIKDDKGSWFVRPNKQKAVNYYNRYIETQSDCKSIHKIRFYRAKAYYDMQNFKEASQDFDAYINSDKSTSKQKAKALWYKGMISLQENINDTVKKQALEYFLSALERYRKYNTFFTLIDENTYIAFKRLTQNILKENKCDFDSITWCSLIGTLFCQSINNTYDNTEQHKHGIACLKYAADHNDLQTQITLAQLDSNEIKTIDKINYLIRALSHQSQIGQREALHDLSRKGFIEASLALIDYYAQQNNEEAIQKILSYNYDSEAQFASSNEQFNELIKKYHDHKVLEKYANACIKYPNKATNTEINATILLGWMYCQSDDHTYLVKGTGYLQTLITKNIVSQNSSSYECVKQCLGETYCKIGQKFTHETNQNIALALAYLQKAAELGNVPAIHCITELWLETYPNINTIKIQIPSKTIFSWILYAIQENRDAHSLYLFGLYYYKHNNLDKAQLYLERAKAAGSEKADKLLKEYNAIAKINKCNRVINAKTPHDVLKGHFQTINLVVGTTSSELLNKNYKSAVKLLDYNRKRATKQFTKLAKQQHPHAYMSLAYLTLTDSITNIDFNLAEKNIRLSLHYGLRTTKDCNKKRFLDNTLIIILFTCIKELVILNDVDKNESAVCLLKSIKHMLTEHRINTIWFAELYELAMKCKLHNNPAWLDG